MAREYIKRVDLENRLHSLCAAQRITAQDAIDIAILPAADVRPVVRGKWVQYQGSAWWCDKRYLYKCSVCGEDAPNGFMGNKVKTRYCAWCGADMREVQND